MEVLKQIIFISTYFMFVKSSATLWIKLIDFENPDGKLSSGHRCDPRLGWFPESACDHEFNVCIEQGENSRKDCIQTGYIYDTNSIQFGSMIGGEKNPMLFTLNEWPGSVKIEIVILDSDDLNYQHVDTLSKVFTYGHPGFNSSSMPTPPTILITNRTRLNLQVKVFCSPNYYGQRCNTHCIGREDQFGHYTCDIKTGRKRCLEGWVGTYCNVNTADVCKSFPCANNGICRSNQMGFTCTCQDGFSGERCRTNIDECSSSPCQNGGMCIDMVNRFQCTCPIGYSGLQCEEDVDECNLYPCKNNGACSNVLGSFTCSCPQEWTGNVCGDDVDECMNSPCYGNSTCLNYPGSFNCSCSSEWTGKLCDIDINECLGAPCFGNATCINVEGDFMCLCTTGRTGDLCEHNIDDCEMNRCHTAAMCVDGIGSYTCVCPPGMEGEHCDAKASLQSTDSKHKHWYIGLIVVTCIGLVIGIVVSVLVRRRRKTKLDDINHRTRNRVYTEADNNTSPATFEEHLYDAVQEYHRYDEMKGIKTKQNDNKE